MSAEVEPCECRPGVIGLCGKCYRELAHGPAPGARLELVRDWYPMEEEG